MTVPEARKMIEHLSADEARYLILELQSHIADKEASMTPAELHEHLEEVPHQFLREAQELSRRFENDMSDLVTNYVIRRGDWPDEYTDNDGDLDHRLIDDDFGQEIYCLTETIIGELFNPEEVEAA